MSTRRGAAPEVRESIEAKTVDEDVEMKDGPEEEDVDAEGDEVDVDMDAEGDEDAEGEIDDEGRPDMFRMISTLSTFLCAVEEEYVSAFVPFRIRITHQSSTVGRSWPAASSASQTDASCPTISKLYLSPSHSAPSE